MLVSFGAPLLEGWGRPGRMIRARKTSPSSSTPALPSAALADEWVEVAPVAGPLARPRARSCATTPRALEAARQRPAKPRLLADFAPPRC
jgi:hypothetical protein